MKTMCTMLPLFFCIYRRQQPSPLTIIPLHCHHPLGSYARRIFRLLWAATWWTSGHRDVKSPLCSKGSFPLFLLRLCLSGYLQCQCRADRICRDIHAANNVLWEKSAYPTPFCYLRPCVSFFGVPYLGNNKRHACVIHTVLHLFVLPLVIRNYWANIHITSSDTWPIEVRDFRRDCKIAKGDC